MMIGWCGICGYKARETWISTLWHLQYYDPLTCDTIEHTKQFSHCDATSINPFPIRAEFNSMALEYVNEAITKCQSHSLIILEGRPFDTVTTNWSNFCRLVATPGIGHYKAGMYQSIHPLIVDYTHQHAC